MKITRPKLSIDGVKSTGGGVIEHAQIARRGIEAPEAGDGRRFFVLIELRIEMPLAAARTVRSEEDAVVGAVERTDVVVVGRLIGDLADDRRFALAEAR